MLEEDILHRGLVKITKLVMKMYCSSAIESSMVRDEKKILGLLSPKKGHG